MIITQEYRRTFAEEYQAMRAFRRERMTLDRMERERWPDDQIEEQKQKTGAAHLRFNQAHEDHLAAAEQQRELNGETESSIEARIAGRWGV